MSSEPPDEVPKFADRSVERPLLIFDGDCGFCRRTVERIREITGDRADYASSQEAGADFPSILPEEFAREVKLVETDGRVYGAAEAVCRLIFEAGKSPWSGVPLWVYRTVPGARRASEAGYHFVATHRMLFSTLVRWLWGNDLRRATFQTARNWFLRALGAIYFIAFLSLRLQVDGLIGKDGILPVAPLLDYVRAQKGVAWGVLHLPSLAWLISGSDGALHFLCNAGMALALLLVVGVAPPLCLALLWMSYLSLATAGQTFLGFQWDVLLLETGFLSIFLAPLRWWTGWRGAAGSGSRVALFLMRWLLFRFMLMSGRGQTDERRRDLAQPHGVALPLRDPAAADLDRLVDAPDAGLVAGVFARVRLRGGVGRAVFRVGSTTRAVGGLLAAGALAGVDRR